MSLGLQFPIKLLGGYGDDGDDDDYIDITNPNKTNDWESPDEKNAVEAYALKLSIQSAFQKNYVEMMTCEKVQHKSEAEKKKLKDEWLRAEDRYFAKALENLAIEEENRAMQEAETRMTNEDHRKCAALLGV